MAGWGVWDVGQASHGKCQSDLCVAPDGSDHSWTFQLLTNLQGLCSVGCFKESVHSSKALVNLGFKGLL